jgi:hypothetical protein
MCAEKSGVSSSQLLYCTRAEHCNKYSNSYSLFSSAFAKFWKATISFDVSVCPSVLPIGTTELPRDGFSWDLVFEYFSKICRKKRRVSLKSDKDDGHLTWRQICIFDHNSLSSSQNEKCFRKCRRESYCATSRKDVGSILDVVTGIFD